MKDHTLQDKALEDVLYEFSLTESITNPATLDRFCRQYPAYSAELTAFAIHQVVASGLANPDPTANAGFATSNVVSRGMSLLQDLLYRHEKEKAVALADPFKGAAGENASRVRSQVGIDATIWGKLRRRLIEPTSIPSAFVDRMANALGVTRDYLLDFWALPGMAVAGENYKSASAPEIGRKQSFEAAVRASSLPIEEQDALLR